MEEIIARDYIVNEKPDVVINILDATNIQRNLYLTTQLLELGGNVVVALKCCGGCAEGGCSQGKCTCAKLSSE